jgi:hypothetical protein
MLDLVAALEAAWAAVRANHPDLPEVVIIIGSGTTSRQAKWGHYGSLRWQHREHRLAEVLISGEGLKRPATEVFATVLHEAGHALADARGIQDTSRQGRWHNARFAALARELGLQPHQDHRIGWSPCTLPDTTTARYATQLASLARALTAYRHPELHLTVGRGITGTTATGTAPGAGRRGNNNGTPCACSCPRRIRVAPSVLNLGTVTCDVCGDQFHPLTGTR